MKKKYYAAAAAAGLAVFAAAGLNNDLILKEYTVRSDKVQRPVRIVFLSDIHSQKYKDEGRQLLSLVDEASPDLIIFGGDIFDKHAKLGSDPQTFATIRAIASKYSECFFVTGNHEYDSSKLDRIRQELSAAGVKFLGESSYIVKAATEQKIIVGGVDYLEDDQYQLLYDQREKYIQKVKESGLFSVFARHVPMFSDEDGAFDLILSGHNHGGLWRFPNTDTGVAGGGKRFFPKFTHGEYIFGDTHMIVSSGITTSTYLLPRIYNQPEVVKITIQPSRRI